MSRTALARPVRKRGRPTKAEDDGYLAALTGVGRPKT